MGTGLLGSREPLSETVFALAIGLGGAEEPPARIEPEMTAELTPASIEHGSMTERRVLRQVDRRTSPNLVESAWVNWRSSCISDERVRNPWEHEYSTD